MEQERTNNEEVLLVKAPQATPLRAVAGIDSDGTVQSVEPTRANAAQFLRIDKQGNALENFFTNFLRQANEPSHFGFFKVTLGELEHSAEAIERLYNGSTDIDDEVTARDAEIYPEEYLRKESQSYKPLDIERVDWAQFEALGIKRETMERSGALEQMANYRKSPKLFDITATIGDVAIRTQAKLSLRENQEGQIIPVIHAVRREPQLSRPYCGHTFTEEDKRNLLKSGNMGRCVDLVNRTTGELTRSYISIDKLTNELISTRADRIKIPTSIKGVELFPEQRQSLVEGRSIYLEGMLSKGGKSFDAEVQVNAERRGIEFRFGESPRQSQSKEFTIPTKLGGQPLSPEQRQTLTEGGTIYVEGLKDRQGKEYNAYVKVNDDGQKLNFYRWNPDVKREQTEEVKQQKSQPKMRR